MSTIRERPAILGGEPAVVDRHAASAACRWPIITDEDIAAVTDVLRSGELSLHRVARELEDDYRNWLDVKHSLACCNGTSAIFAALHAFGLQPRDEVIVPTATYWASIMPVLWCGAVPVFCESEPEQLGLDPDDVAQRITSRTRAMVVVHLCGMPSRMEELMSIARRHNLKVLEDASHAHGARYRGQFVGTFGDAAVFSLQTNKLAPAGEGGILLTNDDGIHEHAQCLGHFERLLDLKTQARRFAGTGFGQKHRMAPLSAAVARVQFRHLAARSAQRSANIETLSRRLEPLGFSTFMAPAGIERVYFMYLIRNQPERTGLPTEQMVAAVQAEGCDVAKLRYPLLHQQPVFTEGIFTQLARLQDRPGETLPTYRADALPRTAAAVRDLIQMPVFTVECPEVLEQYGQAFEKVMACAGEIAALASQAVAE